MKAAAPIPCREQVIVVDEGNRKIDVSDKLGAHRKGLLHRAFSIFLLDGEGRILLQRRQPGKYHSGGLWANSCCGHPRPGESTIVAARRRLAEELGVSAKLRLAFRTRYRIAVSPDMIENELVYVFFGSLDATPEPNPEEVDGLMTLSLAELENSARERPERWAVWLRHYVENHHGDMRRAVDRHGTVLAAPKQRRGATAERRFAAMR